MKKNFQLSDCRVRLATESDTPDLITIAKGIWGGSDYLPRVLPLWLSEPYFFVCEYHGQVISCLKLSLFPDHVLWFEGLRVHKSFQGMGVGSLMNSELFRFAARLKKQDPRFTFEFCTYYQNAESLHLTKKLGFKIVKSFYTMDKNGIKAQKEPRIVTDYDISLFKIYSDYIPLGWQSVHNSPDSLPFIQKRCTVFQTPQARYLLAGVAEKNIVLLSPPVKDFKAELPYFQSFFPPRKRYGMVIPTHYKKHITHLNTFGFRFWDGESRPVKNMLVLKLD